MSNENWTPGPWEAISLCDEDDYVSGMTHYIRSPSCGTGEIKMTTYFLYGLFCLGFIGLMCLIDMGRQARKKNEALAVSQEKARAHLRYRMQLEGRKL